MESVNLLDRVRKTITRYNMLPCGSRVAVAASAGPDSTCLLLALHHLAEELKIKLCVAHCNHNLRGEASELDQCFVEQLAQSLQVPFYVAVRDMRAVAGNLEQTARNARREFFQTLRAEGKADLIALGHTRDDQAETVLFRMLRGSGITGLSGILPVTRQGVVRPMLEVKRSQVQEFLRERQVGGREDSSNGDPRFARNRIRHTLLPMLEREWNPQLKENLAQLADVAYQEELYWQQQMAASLESNYCRTADGSIEIDRNVLAPAFDGLARRLVRGIIVELVGDLQQIEFGHIDSVLELARRQRGEGSVSLPGLDVTRSFQWLRFSKEGARPRVSARQITFPGSYRAADGTQIQLEIAGSVSTQTLAQNGASLESADLDARRVSGDLELRGWRSGDHYRPVGQAADLSLQQMFQRAKIPSWRRAFWPIVTDGQRILWVKRFGAAAECAAGPAAMSVLKIWATKVASESKAKEAFLKPIGEKR